VDPAEAVRAADQAAPAAPVPSESASPPGAGVAEAAEQALAGLYEAVTAEVGDPRAALIVTRFLRETRERTARRQPDGTYFLLTGDIPAMWLRDSAAQVMPYVRLGRLLPGAEEFAVGVLRRQLEYIAIDPYANAFNEAPNGHGHKDRTARDPWVWERKFEVDSLCYPLFLASEISRRLGRADIFDERYWTAAGHVLDVFEAEQDHAARSPYSFRRWFAKGTDTRRRVVAPTGLVWSGFRPSDDPTRYGYHVPGNLFAAEVTRRLAEFAEVIGGPPDFAGRARRLHTMIREGLEEHALVRDPATGPRWAYEVDGRGGVLAMDDANVPSLLALPLIGHCPVDDPVYQATRRWVLSPANPWFVQGRAAGGIGSPHTPRRSVWPIAIAAAGLTAGNRAEQEEAIRVLLATTAGTDRIHESFDADDPSKWTRPWFSWAEAMFAELVLDYCGLGGA
jgi:meiotically up-regulated gene 157 (Mug157) protein